MAAGANGAGGGGNGGSNAEALQARAEAMQREAQEFQVMMLEIQTRMSISDRAFQVMSGIIEKGDKDAEKVGDRIAN